MKTTKELLKEYFDEYVKNERLKFISYEDCLGTASSVVRIHYFNMDTKDMNYIHLSSFDYSTFLFNKLNRKEKLK